MEDRASEKKERLLAALDRGLVMVHLDPRRPGVVVPPTLTRMPHLNLNLSYNFPGRDLSVDGWGIRSTLSFSGDRFTVAIPWSALFGICSHLTQEEWLFPEDLPAELSGAPVPAAGPRRRLAVSAVALRGVRGERGPETPDNDPPPNRSHLRLIK